MATIGLIAGAGMLRQIAWVACTIELLGVLTVGTASLIFTDAFPDATVWSEYGVGYLLIPLELPVIGLWWLRRTGNFAIKE